MELLRQFRNLYNWCLFGFAVPSLGDPICTSLANWLFSTDSVSNMLFFQLLNRQKEIDKTLRDMQKSIRKKILHSFYVYISL